MARRFVALLTLVGIFFLVAFGVCVRMTVFSMGEMNMQSMNMASHNMPVADHCDKTATKCPFSLEDHFSWFLSLLISKDLSQGAMIALLAFLFIPFAFIFRWRWALLLEAGIKRIERIFPYFSVSISPPSLVFAFSRGILHPKRYSA